MKHIALAAALSLPLFASAAFNASPLEAYIGGVVSFVNGYIIPLIMAAAIVAFIWGMFQYFVLGGANEEKREKGKQVAVWAVIGLVLMLSLQGIVMLLVEVFGFGGGVVAGPDINPFQ
ncbi:MAG: Type secretion system pilin [Candidatus Parcubacteria bacterium]|jgi:hypothetical protein